jgi:hypothetical protein
MMLGEQIWGQSFIDELSRPHPDPEIRRLEEMAAEMTWQMILRQFEPKPMRDCLPEHYRKMKIGGRS